MYTFHFSLLVPSLYLFCVHTSVRRPTTDHVCLPHSLSTLFCCVRICAGCVCLCIYVCVCTYVCVCVCMCTCVHWPMQAFVRLLGQRLTRISPSISTNSLPYFLRQDFYCNLEFDILTTLATGESLGSVSFCTSMLGYSH